MNNFVDAVFGGMLWLTLVLCCTALLLVWCLIVFLLTGRLPWMVRKHF